MNHQVRGLREHESKPYSNAMSDCIFCGIVAGDIPSKKVLETDTCLAFLDIFPANRGHTLVIPKEHVADIFASDAKTYSAVAGTAKEVADLVTQKLSSDGVSIFQMNREAGWQTVFHLHMHVIPRWENDDLHKPWDIAPASEDSLSEVLRQLQN
jgi:histidine triad (HIT) family protein